MQTKKEILKDLNLNEKEVEVYLSLLMLGRSNAHLISKKANINRTSTYDVLDSLFKRGFVSYVIVSGVKNFEAVEPAKLLDDMKEKQAKFEKILPELETIKHSLIEKPKIELYEGIEGLKSIFVDLLRENQKADFIVNPEMLDSLKYYFPHFLQQKRKQKIFSNVITNDCAKIRKFIRENPEKTYYIKFIDNPIKMSKIFYANKVAFMTFKEKNSVGVIIENEEIGNTEKEIFNVIWNSAKDKTIK